VQNRQVLACVFSARSFKENMIEFLEIPKQAADDRAKLMKNMTWK